jgi:hypothetical protein
MARIAHVDLGEKMHMACSHGLRSSPGTRKRIRVISHAIRRAHACRLGTSCYCE